MNELQAIIEIYRIYENSYRDLTTRRMYSNRTFFTIILGVLLLGSAGVEIPIVWTGRRKALLLHSVALHFSGTFLFRNMAVANQDHETPLTG